MNVFSTVENTFTYLQDHSDGMWLGHLNEYPDYQTEGCTLDDQWT